MRTLAVLGYLSIGLMVAVGCGESKGTNHQVSEPPGRGDGAGEGGAESGDSGGTGGSGAVSGGRATGGNASGGSAASGGAAGNGGAPARVELPKGCRVSRDFSGGGTTDLGVSCGDEDYDISCVESSAGEWRCRCSGDESYSGDDTRTYYLEAADAEQAAMTAALACAGEDPDFGAAPEDCELEEGASTSFCTMTETCRRSAEVLPGVSVALVGEMVSYECERESEDSTVCRCNDASSQVVRFQNPDLERGCGFARAYCTSSTKSVVEAPVCTPTLAEDAGDLCSLVERCATPTELDDGRVVTPLLTRGMNCERSATDRAGCRCQADGVYLGFDLDWGAMLGATCSDALELCERLGDAEREGAESCELSTQVASEPACDAVLNCRQPAKIGEAEIELRGSIHIACKAENGEATCDCVSQLSDGSLAQTAVVSIGAVDGLTACSVAEAYCLEAIDVVYPDQR